MTRAELLTLVRGTGCAQEHGEFVFLCDPRWSADEQARTREWADTMTNRVRSGAAEAARGWLCVPTGGSSGVLRFARHDEQTVAAAAGGFVTHFGLRRVNAVDVLPPFHVSGLMARVRCAASGGVHVPWDWKRLERGERPSLPEPRGDWVLSLVPTQLQRLLASESAAAWLRDFAVVFVGGGPVWPALTDAAAEARLRVSLSYGMTETAAMVAAQTPEEFLAGDRSSGRVMPHARLDVATDGVIRIAGDSVCRGYAPEFDGSGVFETSDVGQVDAEGKLCVLGRRDAVIITGGEKVQPMEVEAVLRATGEFDDVAVIGLTDAEWGEVVVACYRAAARAPNLDRVRECVAQALAGFKRPKVYREIANWPRSEHGKLDRAALRRAAVNGRAET
jgi:O-succinylbenzoic acid--CoA ligase